MVHWLRKLFGIAGVAATATTSQAQPATEWAGYIEAARDLSGGDREIETLLRLASEDPGEFEAALDTLPYKGADWFIDYDPNGDPAGSLFRDAMMAKNFLVYLDWKEGADEIFGQYDNQMQRLGLPVLTSQQRAEMEAAEPIPAEAGRLFFTDYVGGLDADATTKEHRVLVFDENADSYAFFVVTPDQHARWADQRMGEDHRFFSSTAFLVDQYK